MRRAFAFALLLPTFALALPPARDAWAAPADWIVDQTSSRLSFTGAVNGEAFSGSFGRWDATIVFDPTDLAHSHVTAFIETSSARTGDQTRDEALPTADWFASEEFPKAVFTSQTIHGVRAGHYVADGTLTIRNMTRPISLPFTLAITGDRANMSGSVSLDRSLFGVGQGQWQSADAVAFKVDVTILINARKAKPAAAAAP
jgi:polyisoprenoid-binding protein YceI